MLKQNQAFAISAARLNLAAMNAVALLSQVAFVLIAGFAIWLFSRNILRIRKVILLGRDEDLTGNKPQRWKNMLLLAFGQKKMFRNPLVAVMHLFVYVGFVIINIEVLEIVLDGATGKHRLFLRPMGKFYPAFINAFEVLAILVLASCIIFLLRRNIARIKRLKSKDLTGWPKSDANYILITEIILMTLFLTMNAADTLLQKRVYADYGQYITGNFFFSSFIHPLLNGLSNSALLAVERTCWWLHIIGIFSFLNYLPYSKHLHILFAFPNAYYTRLKPQGKMKNMPEIQQEVLFAMQPELATNAETATHKFGAKDITDLSWKNLLDAYSCTECGRCSAACPANITGKVLSPRLIMMKTRDRAEAISKNNFVAGEKTLLHDYITEEELRACTTCQACVQECPVSIDPLDIIVQLRRYLIMEESNATPEWNNMFSNTENNFAPWKFSPEDRDMWVEKGS